jgi:hypothetical protein
MKLSAEPDGFGFFYGWVQRNGERMRVDVLPPDHLWRGDIKLKGQKPDPKAWVLYLDGGSSGARMHLRCWALRVPRGRAGCLLGGRG